MKDKKLHTIQDDKSAVETIKEAARCLNDQGLVISLSEINTARSRLKYHGRCYREYMYKTNRTQQSTDKVETPVKDPFIKAFIMLTDEIDDDLFVQGKAFTLKYLLQRYTELLAETKTEQTNYHTKNLQYRLKSHYGDRVIIQVQGGWSRSNIMFSSAITVGQAISAVAALQESITLLSECGENQHKPENSTVNNEDRVNTLYYSAKYLRSELQKVKEKENVQNSQVISNEHAESLVPDSLYMFVRWLLEDESGKHPISEQKEKSLKPDVHRLILSLSQDLIFACNRSVLPPKHIGIGIAIKHLTGSKELIRMMNRFGHCISYDAVIRLENRFMQQEFGDNKDADVTIPSNISKGKFVQAAADNLDFNEETLDGKQTTHATTLVLYQRAGNGRFGAEVNTKAGKERKPLSDLKLSMNNMNFVKQCHRLQLPECMLRNEEFTDVNCQSRSVAKYIDMAWIFARLCPSKDFQVSLEKVTSQTIPSWTEFNAIVTTSKSEVTSVGYCPMIPASPTEYSTVYTVMKTVQNMMKTLEQQHSVITFDEAIYCKAKEIQWRCPDQFKDTVLRLGGFHTALAFISVIGKRYEESGLEDLLIESGVYGLNSVVRIMNGKTYNKSVRALKLLIEAFSRLMIHSLVSKLTKKEEYNIYIDSISALKDSITNPEEQEYDLVMQDIQSKGKAIGDEIREIRETCKAESSTFAYWDEFLEMVEILLRFIRAERNAIWSLHINALSDMLPYFFAYDRINYARWASVYLSDMKSLPITASNVYNEFINGNHPIKRAAGTFNQVWTYLALEQSVNRDSKVKGGIVGFTQQKDTVNRWLLTAHTRANIVSSVKTMCETNDCVSDRENGTNIKECGNARLGRDEDDVQKLLGVLTEQMLNPFDTDQHKTDLIMNLATGVTSTDEVSKDLGTASNVGKACFEKFVKSRLVQGR